MGKRFEALEDVYNTLVAANFNFESLPATNKYRKYSEWKQNPELRVIGNSTDSGRKSLVSLKAFGLDDGGGTEDVVLVKVGSRALAEFNAISSKAKFNLTVDNPTGQKKAGYTPAVAVLSKVGAASTETSKITGQRYKSATTGTYTVPFGKGATAATSTEFGVQDALLADSTIAASYTLTFKPERLRRR
jgi:hypothetical protein